MTDTITLTGLVATPPKHVVAGEGSLPITSFRLASTQRRFDRNAQKWIDGETNWYTITSFRTLAEHVITSVDKGQRVLVVGRLRVRDWEKDDRSGTNIEIVAEALGHDLSWGTATFTRTPSPATDRAPSDGASDDSEGASLLSASELPVPF